MMASAKGYRELIADLASERRSLARVGRWCGIATDCRPQITQACVATISDVKLRSRDPARPLDSASQRSVDTTADRCSIAAGSAVEDDEIHKDGNDPSFSVAVVSFASLDWNAFRIC